MAEKAPKNRSSTALILFPEIIGVTAAAFVTPVLLWKLRSAGHAIWAVVGLTCWIVALLLTLRLIFRRQYAIALVPMFAILGLCLLLLRVVPE